MNLIIPMAGRGSRLRPHTLTTPKPLLPVAGKPIVQRLVEDIAAMVPEPIQHIAFVIGDFGTEIENQLLEIAKQAGAQGHIVYQTQPLGTAHAILCAEKLLNGKVLVAFADTLFRASFNINTEQDGVIYVKQIEDPRQFGVVNLDSKTGAINQFEEKPEVPKSDLAIIGIYFFKSGAGLKSELQYLIDNNITDKGEFSVTTALANMTAKGLQFFPGAVDDWMDCGNKNITVETNSKVLAYMQHSEQLIDPLVQTQNAVIIPPCYIGKNVTLSNSIIGPNVSIGHNSRIENCVITSSIIQANAKLENLICSNSMIGQHASWKGKAKDLSIGDYNGIVE